MSDTRIVRFLTSSELVSHGSTYRIDVLCADYASARKASAELPRHLRHLNSIAPVHGVHPLNPHAGPVYWCSIIGVPVRDFGVGELMGQLRYIGVPNAKLIVGELDVSGIATWLLYNFSAEGSLPQQALNVVETGAEAGVRLVESGAQTVNTLAEGTANLSGIASEVPTLATIAIIVGAVWLASRRGLL